MKTSKDTKSPGAWRTFKALVLNLPDPEVPSLADRLKGRTPSAKTGTPPPAPSEKPSAWSAAAAQARPASPEPAEEEETLWEAVIPSAKSSRWKRFVRWSAIGLILLFLWIGLRAAIFGVNSNTTPQEVPLTATFNHEQAAGTAQRFTVAYLSWDEANKDQRAKNMSPWYSGGNAPAELGWDGHGKQTAQNATVRNVEPLDKDHARVMVTADVTPYQKGKAQPTQTQTLEVKVQVTEDGSAVYGAPGVVGNPQPITATEAEDNTPNDSVLSQQTKPEAQTFFTSYGSETDLASITAPGAMVQGLGGALKDPKLREWTVKNGAEDHRAARAVVQWTTKSGAKSQQTYELKLVKVSGGQSAKWQVETINGTE